MTEIEKATLLVERLKVSLADASYRLNRAKIELKSAEAVVKAIQKRKSK
tara:strand:+ start:570 stop:716 length:147 start_codon:yes stop_codon:yes gene_type:complete